MKCNIWLTLNNDNPDLEDIAKIRYELEEILRDDFPREIGICLSPKQWSAFLMNTSRFEQRMISLYPREIMGFPVRLIHLFSPENLL
jgi:hypothetical protein